MQPLTPTSTTVLLVAQSDQRRTSIAQQLEALGYSVITLDNRRTLADALKLSRFDLLIVDLNARSVEETRDLAQLAAELLAQGIPVLTLTAEQLSPEGWTHETLSNRVAAVLRNRDAADILTERAQRWDGLNVLDPETLLFSRRYFDAIFAIELERSRRVHQPTSILLIDLGNTPDIPPTVWRTLSARLLMSLRQTDLLVRYGAATVLVLLPFTEAIMARAVAARLLKALTLQQPATATLLQVRIGIAAYPTHAATPEAVLSAAHHALDRASATAAIINFEQI